MKQVMLFVPWLLAALGAIFGGALVLYALVAGTLSSATDYAVIGAGLAVTAYVLARAVEALAHIAGQLAPPESSAPRPHD
jgi:hypothetical protein